MSTTGGDSSNSLASNGHNQVTSSNHTRSAPSLAITSFISKIQGALAPQKVKYTIDKRTLDKTWKNMDKGK